MPIIIPANSAASGGYEVANSVRLDFASSTRFERTPSSASNRRTWTFSSWLKKAADENSNGDFQQLFSCPGAGGAERIMFEANKLTWDFDIAGVDYSVATVAVQRDPSAFYHIVVTKDTTQGTEANRVKMYINGVQQTLAEIQLGFPDQNAEGSINTTAEHQIWAQQDGAEMSGYACETCFVDGTALAADSFGEFDEDSGVWKPIDVSALTLGTNGYFLNYQDSSALGNSSNSNNYTTANLTAIDQSTDTCTLNGCTMNPLSNYWTNGAQFFKGNLEINTNTSGKAWNMSTIGLPSGKWYMEGKYTATGGGAPSDNWNRFGIVDREPTSNSDLGASANAYALTQYDGSKYVSGTNSTYAAAWAIGDVIAMAIDLDNNKIYWSKNGAWGNGSGAWGSTTFNAGTGAVTVVDPTLTLNGYYFVAMGDAGVNVKKTWQFNFGSPPYAISSGNQDGNDYGNFEYAVPSGFLTINSANLSEELS